MEKGECFKNVYDYALDHGTPNMVIVHGKVSKRDGTPIDHAWLEDGDTVIEPTFVIAGRDIKWDRNNYYEKLNAKPEAKYGAMDAVGLTIRAKNFGPWAPEEQRGKNMLHEEKEAKIDPKELAVGTEVEKEHFKDPKKAEKVAVQHLKEPGHEKYYTNLNKCGLIDEPKAKKLAKRYLVSERQIRLIGENIMKEEPSLYSEGDTISVLTPVEGYGQLKTMGVVKHVDAAGTVRAEFNINGKNVLIPLDPEVDKISKFDDVQYE